MLLKGKVIGFVRFQTSNEVFIEEGGISEITLYLLCVVIQLVQLLLSAFLMRWHLQIRKAFSCF